MTASKEIMKRPKMMPQGMQGRGMRGGQMQGQGRHMRGRGQGRGGQHAPIAQRRSIDGGEVTLGYLPADLTTGQIDLRIHVLDVEGEYNQDATASAFLYPEGNPGIGKTLDLQSHRGGRFMAMTTLPTMGQWELAVRVSRPGKDDVKVYFPLQVSQ